MKTIRSFLREKSKTIITGARSVDRNAARVGFAIKVSEPYSSMNANVEGSEGRRARTWRRNA
jgi:hypothetical protein